jgi:glycosyltransferase involved in cell wall biosynthesis
VNAKILFIDQTGQVGGAELCLADLAFRLRERGTVLLFESGPFRDLLLRRGVHTLVLNEGYKTPQQPEASDGPGEIRKSRQRRRFPKRICPREVPKVNKKSGIDAYIRALPNFSRLFIGTLRIARTFDFLYANTAKAVVVTAVVAAALRKPFIFHLHDIIDGKHFNWVNRKLLVAAANLAAGVIANSKATAAAYRSAGGRNANLFVIPNGFTAGSFIAGTEDKTVAIRRATDSSDSFLIGVFGRITPWKGQKVLVEAVSRLPQVKAVVVGDALFTEQDQQYKRELVDLCQQLGVADRVHFTGFQQNVLPLLHAVDLVVHCSVAPEPFGRVIVEAQLAGKPVIAARSGAPTEIIEDGVNGLLVTPGSAEELATAIRALLLDPAWAGSIASNGRQSAENRYALDKVLRDWTDFIDRSISANGNRQSQGSASLNHSEANKIREQNTTTAGLALEPRPTQAGTSV